jgi:hypothetical protein
MAQAVECLLYKWEAPSSNPSPTKKKNKQNPVRKTGKWEITLSPKFTLELAALGQSGASSGRQELLAPFVPCTGQQPLPQEKRRMGAGAVGPWEGVARPASLPAAASEASFGQRDRRTMGHCDAHWTGKSQQRQGASAAQGIISISFYFYFL